jgi:DNA polymerase-3 subunit epsilon
MGRCLSPCLGDLDPNLYRRRLDEALRLFVAGGDGGERLLAHVRAQMREAADRQLYERAAWLRRRLRRLRVLLERLGGALEATHVRARLILAAHPVDATRRDAFWLVGGRLVDWGAAPDDNEALEERTQRALMRGGRAGELGAHVPPDEIDELRIIANYLAAHPETPQLALERGEEGGGLLERGEEGGGVLARGEAKGRLLAPREAGGGVLARGEAEERRALSETAAR